MEVSHGAKLQVLYPKTWYRTFETPILACVACTEAVRSRFVSRCLRLLVEVVPSSMCLWGPAPFGRRSGERVGEWLIE